MPIFETDETMNRKRISAMSYRRDDGTTICGIAIVVAVVMAFAAGYWCRDQGISIKVLVPQVRSR